MPHSQRDIDAVHEAAEQNKVTTLMALVQQDATLVRCLNDIGDQPLHTACWQKHWFAATMLIQHGADVNERGCNGMTPLHCAVHDTDYETCLGVVGVLIGEGADPSIEDENCFSAVQWARREVRSGLDLLLELLDSTEV